MKNEPNDSNGREISLSRTLNAPVELVWEAWTKPEQIANWWGPEGFTNTINNMDVKAGGEWNLIMHSPDGRYHENWNIFREVIEHKKIVFDHVSDPKSVTTIELENMGSKTVLSWHMMFESPEVFQRVMKEHGASEGMHQNASRLERYLEIIND